MSLKDALKVRKANMKEKNNEGFWQVRLDVEVVEQVHIVEYVKAPSKAEAQAIALTQFHKRTPVIVHDRAARVWNNDGRHNIQHLNITKTERRKKFTISRTQRFILNELRKGKYLEHGYNHWSLVDPSVKPSWKNFASNSVPNVSVDSLFQKGLLTDLVTSRMSEQEAEMQKALGSLPKLVAYTIDEKVVKILGLRL